MSIAQIGLPNNPQQLIQLAQQGNVAALGKLAQLQKQAQMMKAVQSNQAMQAQEPPTVMQQTAQQVEGAGGIASPVAMARGGRVRRFSSGGGNDAPSEWRLLIPAALAGDVLAQRALGSVATGLGYPSVRALIADAATATGKNAASAVGKRMPASPKSAAGRAGVLGLLGSTLYDTASTDTEDFRKRFGMETDDPSFLGDLAARGLGAASNLGNAATLGYAEQYFRDKQEKKETPSAAPKQDPSKEPDYTKTDPASDSERSWTGGYLPNTNGQPIEAKGSAEEQAMARAYNTWLAANPMPKPPSGIAAAAPGAADAGPPAEPPTAPPAFRGPPAPEPDEPDAGGLAAVAPGARAAMREKVNEAQRNAAYARNAYQSEMLNRLKPQQEAWYQTLGRIGGHLAKGNGQMNQSALQTLAGAAPGLIADMDMRAKATRDWENQAAQLGIDTSDRYAKQAMSELEGAYKDDAQDRADKKTALEERKVSISEKDRDTKNKLAEKRIVLQEQTRAAITRIQLAKAEASAKGQQLKPDMVFKMAQQAYAKAKEMGLSDTDAEEASNRIRMEAYVTNNELARSSASGTIPSAAAGISGPVSPPKWK